MRTKVVRDEDVAGVAQQVCIKVCCSCCVHPGRDQHLEHAGSGHKASGSWTWGWWLRWCHCGFKSRLPIPNTMRARQYAVTSMLHEQICRQAQQSWKGPDAFVCHLKRQSLPPT
ncbi:hypothetical protein WJX82_003536 [Trebouxia sp. C0006]